MGTTNFDLTGKIAIVTGGGSGIGKAIATRLARHRATVFIFDNNEKQGEESSKELAKEGLDCHFLACDVSSSESVKNAFQDSLQSKSLNILINNAGIAHIGTATSTSETDFERILNVNIKGAFLCTQEAIERMTEGGSIVNVGSVAALVGVPERFAYSISKGAIHAMTLSVAKDYIDQKIRCNTIAPARIHTPFVDGFLKKNYPGKEKEMFDALSKTQPIGRMGQPDEVASMALYLCSDEASFITGTCFPVDGGFTTLNT